jgi:hypothetical protein
MSLTIDEVKKRKIDLEGNILKLVQSFEKETDSFISYISFERKVSKNTKKGHISEAIAVPEPERDGPIANVTADLRFDI